MIGKRYSLVVFFAVLTLFFTYNANGAGPGDTDGSGKVDLKDAIIVLQLDSGKMPSSTIFLETDVNNDERVGIVEAIFDLQSFFLDYNKDGSNVRVFFDGDVNDYVTIQQRLSTQINANDDIAFHNIFEIYVTDLLENSFPVDSIPSYAPRGESKKLTIDVANGKIDYSNYILKGDINLDSAVDFIDLEALKAALFSSSSETKYDVNSDGIIDVLDMIFLLARIGTEVSYFDFYTTAGEKIITIPIREAYEPRIFDYSGPETQVMVVPKDINKASGFISGLSDIDDVWYKKTGWIYQDDDVVINSIEQDDIVVRQIAGRDTAAETGKGKIIEDTLDKLIDFEKVKNNPYLVGWHLDVRYVNAGTFKELDTYGMDGSASYILPYENRIRDPHFAKTTMMHDLRSVTKIAYVVQLGIESDPVNVEALRQPITGTLIRDGETIVVRQRIQAVSITFTSREEHTLSGDILGSNNNLQGNVNLYRIGPYPDEKDFGSAQVTDGSFNVPNLPYGAYKIDFENKCGCSTEMENSFVFKDEETNIFEVEEATKNVTIGLTIVTRVDDADEPLPNKAITIKSTDCVSEEKIASSTTNGEGFVEFNDIPIGQYDVYVDGKVASSIAFCDNYNGSVIVANDHLWKFKVVYNSEYGSGTITATDIDIDFEAEADPGGTKIYAAAESTCGGDLYECADFYIFNDTIVNPGTKWVSFGSMIILDPESQLEGQMISAEMDYGMNCLVCDGHIPAGFDADSDTTTWTYSDGCSTWTFTLEPCAPGGCD